MMYFSSWDKEKMVLPLWTDFKGLEWVWCLENPIENIDSLTDFNEIDDIDALLKKTEAFLHTVDLE